MDREIIALLKTRDLSLGIQNNRLALRPIGSGMITGRSHDAVIRVYDDAGNVIGTHDEHKGDSKEW